MRAWWRSVAATAVGLLAGASAQVQAQFGPEGPAAGPFPVPTLEGSAVYGAEPDINGRPFVPKPKSDCPRFPYLNALLFGDPIIERPYLTPGWSVLTLRDGPLPFPVATTGNLTGVGAIGNPDTRVLLGNSGLDYGNFSAFTLNGGFWWAGTDLGIDAVFTTLGKQTVSGSVSNTPNGVLSRPFFDTNLPGQNVSLLSFPGAFENGRVSFASSSQLWSLDLTSVLRLVNDESYQVDLLAGAKYLRLQEDLYIASSTRVAGGGVATFAGNPVLPPSTIDILDSTNTIVQFYGGTLGSRFTYIFGQFTASAHFKASLGNSSNTILGRGSSFLNNNTTADGGLLVVGLNDTRRQEEKIAWMPEAGANLTWTPIRYLAFNIGYNFAYLSRVARPGNQFEFGINPTRVPTNPNFGVNFGPTAPNARVDFSDMWFSQINFGVSLRY